MPPSPHVANTAPDEPFLTGYDEQHLVTNLADVATIARPDTLGYEISDQTVGNVLRCHGLLPAPERKHTITWAAFIRTHVALLAGTDFFAAEVLTLRGLVPAQNGHLVSQSNELEFRVRLRSRNESSKARVDRNVSMPMTIWLRRQERYT